MAPHDELELLSAYLDGELEAVERARVDSHIPSCPECRTTLEALRATLTELHALPHPAPTPQGSWALRAVLRRERTTRRRRWQRAAMTAGTVAAAAVTVLAISLGGNGGGRPSLATREAAERANVPVVEFTGNLTETQVYAQLLQEAGIARGQLAPLATPLARQGAGGTGLPAAQDFTVYATGDTGGETNAFAVARATPSAQIDRCAETARSSTQQFLQPIKYALATYENTPAFLMFFRLEDRVELWVTARDDCRLLYFAQAKAAA